MEGKIIVGWYSLNTIDALGWN